MSFFKNSAGRSRASRTCTRIKFLAPIIKRRTARPANWVGQARAVSDPCRNLPGWRSVDQISHR